MQNMLFCNIDAVKPVCRERGASSEGLLSENMPIKSQCLLLKLFISSPLKKEQDYCKMFASDAVHFSVQFDFDKRSL